MLISVDIILVIYFVLPLLSMSKGSFLNISSITDRKNDNGSFVQDQETSDTQQFAVQDFNMDLFNQASGGTFGDQHPASDLKMWEAIPIMEENSHLSQFLQPPNTQLIDLSNFNQHTQGPDINNFNGYEHQQHTQGSDMNNFNGYEHHVQGGDINNFNGYDHHLQGVDVYDDLYQGNYYGKPSIGGLLGGFHKGGLKTPFPRLKLKKLSKPFRPHGLFRKHRGYGHYFGDSGGYIGQLAHQFSSIYQPFIPKFTPFPINFPSFGSTGGGFNELEIFKAILIPLAGVALMGAAATTMLVTNPFIWSLPFSLLIGPSTFGHFFGRRRRRAADSGPDKNVVNGVLKNKIEEIKVLDEFLKKTSKAEVIVQEKKVLATYLMTQSVCLDRLVCSLHRPNLPETMTQEGRVMNIVTKEILENEFVPQIIHDNILRARQVGLASGNCQTFVCQPVSFWAHQQR